MDKPEDAQQLAKRAVELADAFERFQEDLGVSGEVDELRSWATEADKQFAIGRLMRRIVVPAVAVCLIFTGVSGYLGNRLSNLVHTECVRSAKSADLRTAIIDELTRPIKLPPPGEARPPVLEYNKQRREIKAKLLHLGSEIPNVKC